MFPCSGNVLDHVVVRYGGYNCTNGTPCANVAMATSAVTLSNSEVTDSANYGVRVESAAPTITNNRVERNPTGIYVTASGGLVLSQNTIGGSLNYGVYNATSSILIDARNNYWQTPTGPLDNSDDLATGGDYNPTGTGDHVTDYVNYRPWLDFDPNLSASGTATPTPTPTRTAPPSGSKTATPTSTRISQPSLRLVYYALGDSIASGHGLAGGTGRIPTISLPDGTVLSTCQRSPNAYPWAVASKLALIPGLKNRVVTRHLACTGAKSFLAHSGGQLTDLPGGLTDLPAQVSQVQQEVSSAPGQYTLVSITIGADDIDFPNELKHGSNLCQPDDTFNAWVLLRSSQLQKLLTHALRNLLNTTPNVYIVLTDYPNPFKVGTAYFEEDVDLAFRGDLFGGDLLTVA